MSNEHLKIYGSYMKTIVWMSSYHAFRAWTEIGTQTILFIKPF